MRKQGWLFAMLLLTAQLGHAAGTPIPTVVPVLDRPKLETPPDTAPSGKVRTYIDASGVEQRSDGGAYAPAGGVPNGTAAGQTLIAGNDPFVFAPSTYARIQDDERSPIYTVANVENAYAPTPSVSLKAGIRSSAPEGEPSHGGNAFLVATNAQENDGVAANGGKAYIVYGNPVSGGQRGAATITNLVYGVNLWASQDEYTTAVLNINDPSYDDFTSPLMLTTYPHTGIATIGNLWMRCLNAPDSDYSLSGYSAVIQTSAAVDGNIYHDSRDGGDSLILLGYGVNGGNYGRLILDAAGTGDGHIVADGSELTNLPVPENATLQGNDFNSANKLAQVADDGWLHLDLNGDVAIQRPDWISQTPAEANAWNGVCENEGIGLLVAVAGSGTNRVMTSDYGITWTAHPAAEDNSWSDVATNGPTHGFVAVATDGTHRVMTSDNGTSWTARTAGEANAWTAVCGSPSKWVAVSYNGTNRSMSSTDGESWSAHSTIGSNALSDVCYSPYLDLFVAVGHGAGSANYIQWSTDGDTWNAWTWVGGGPGGDGYYSIAWSPEQRVFLALGTSTPAYSYDGKNWTLTGGAFGSQLVCWSSDLNLFLSTKPESYNHYVFSMIGADWDRPFIDRHITPATSNWASMFWSHRLKLFVAVGNGVIYTSPYGSGSNVGYESVGGFNLNKNGIETDYGDLPLNGRSTNTPLGLVRLDSSGICRIPNGFAGPGSLLTNLPNSINFTGVASGSAYSLTTTPARLNFGADPPVIAITQPGTYLISAYCRIDYNGATHAANRTITLKLRQTNNTAADLANSTHAFMTETTTTLSKTAFTPTFETIYTTTSTEDVIELWGSINTAPSLGSDDAVEAYVRAVKLY